MRDLKPRVEAFAAWLRVNEPEAAKMFSASLVEGVLALARDGAVDHEHVAKAIDYARQTGCDPDTLSSMQSLGDLLVRFDRPRSRDTSPPPPRARAGTEPPTQRDAARPRADRGHHRIKTGSLAGARSGKPADAASSRAGSQPPAEATSAVPTPIDKKEISTVHEVMANLSPDLMPDEPPPPPMRRRKKRKQEEAAEDVETSATEEQADDGQVPSPEPQADSEDDADEGKRPKLELVLNRRQKILAAVGAVVALAALAYVLLGGEEIAAVPPPPPPRPNEPAVVKDEPAAQGKGIQLLEQVALEVRFPPGWKLDEAARSKGNAMVFRGTSGTDPEIAVFVGDLGLDSSEGKDIKRLAETAEAGMSAELKAEGGVYESAGCRKTEMAGVATGLCTGRAVKKNLTSNMRMYLLLGQHRSILAVFIAKASVEDFSAEADLLVSGFKL